MPRFFTLLEAEGLLPEVERILRESVAAKHEYAAAEAQLNALLQRIQFAGGMVAPRDQIAELRNRKEASAAVLAESIRRFEEMGCQLKDLETGLVDFPTLYRNREVYLCWKLGEPGISFWHRVEDGFRGRKPIDSDFLAHHKGSGSSSVE